MRIVNNHSIYQIYTHGNAFSGLVFDIKRAVEDFEIHVWRCIKTHSFHRKMKRVYLAAVTRKILSLDYFQCREAIHVTHLNRIFGRIQKKYFRLLLSHSSKETQRMS